MDFTFYLFWQLFMATVGFSMGMLTLEVLFVALLRGFRKCKSFTCRF